MRINLRFDRLLALILLLCASLAAAAAPPAPTTQVELEVFVREGCRHCEEADRFLADLSRERTDLVIIKRDIRKDPGARERLIELASDHAIQTPGVPAFYLRDELIVGFGGDATTGARIRSLLDQAYSPSRPAESASGQCAIEETASCSPDRPTAEAEIATVEIPFLGTRLNIDELGLPLFSFLLGLLDGFNPCSMWVLIFMISMLAGLKDLAKMLAIAGTFVAVEGIAYFAFMAAWLNLFLVIGISRPSEIILGLIAGIAGMINVKDFWAFGRGISLSIPESAKPGLYARIRAILQAENMTAALAGTVVLAVLVQIVEIMCTSGFPALFTRILTMRHLEGWSYYGYLLIYNIAYMLDDMIVLAVGVITLSRRRLQEKEGRWLKLMSGVVMLGLAVYLIAAPG
ncbi:MAG: NrdH-redoxin [Betaproteobacteria bacterium]|nr:NrdH-redoxin [Betaproteobacteria bacterium]